MRALAHTGRAPRQDCWRSRRALRPRGKDDARNRGIAGGIHDEGRVSGRLSKVRGCPARRKRASRGNDRMIGKRFHLKEPRSSARSCRRPPFPELTRNAGGLPRRGDELAIGFCTRVQTMRAAGRRRGRPGERRWGGRDGWRGPIPRARSKATSLHRRANMCRRALRAAGAAT
jgi:hypothetical protein